MADMEHEAVVAVLFKYFDKPNNGVIRGPIKVLGAPYHYNPIGSGNKIAPDVAICPSIAHVLNPLIDHQGPPPRNANNRPHARIVCEVGNTQTIFQWNAKCELWMHEEYVRCVLGIKLFPKTIMGTTVHRAMIARLWTRVASAGGVLSQNATLARAGVYVME
ncbi:14544_t:CDS:2, partial [Funneliformis caledonium]